MIVCGLKKATLSVIFGNHKYAYIDVALDEDYAGDLIEAEWNFWSCVKDGTVPVIVAGPYTGPVDRIVDFTGNNTWATAAAYFLNNQPAAKLFDAAKADLKDLVPVDAAKAFGHGIIATRSKTGALTIKESK
jgi:hypothetical protein